MSGFQVIRLASGDTVQVRSGVLQGLGPQGSQGPQGTRGVQGESGPQGEKGDIGFLDAFRCYATINSSQSIGISTPTNVNFTNSVDDLGLQKSVTNFTPDDEMDLKVSGFVRFNSVADGGTGWRQLQILNGTTVLYEDQRPAVYSGNTSIGFSCSIHLLGGETARISVQHNDNEAVAVGAGAVTFYRQGSGPRGLQGVQGNIGNTGATGPAGPAGPAGSAGTGYATIDAMGT